MIGLRLRWFKVHLTGRAHANRPYTPRSSFEESQESIAGVFAGRSAIELNFRPGKMRSENVGGQAYPRDLEDNAKECLMHKSKTAKSDKSVRKH